MLLGERADDFAAHDVKEPIGLLEGFPDDLTLGYVEILKTLCNLQSILIGQWNDRLLEKLHLLDNFNQLADVLRASILRRQFHHHLDRLFKVLFRMKLMR